MRSERFTCDHCGHVCDISELTEFDGQDLCSDCISEHTAICSHCGERYWLDDDAGDDDTFLCRRCYENYYTHCDHCGRLIEQDDACYGDSDEDEDYPLCSECYHDQNGGVRDYYYKPEPIFYGEGNRYFGVELEIDEAGESDSAAQEIMAIANRRHDHLYCKHDGSLNDGIELVSHPMTLKYHMSDMPWAEVLRKAVNLGYLSHQCGTCGLHVHVNRSSFGAYEKDQDAVIARILFFVENHWNEMLRFSRRTQRQMEQWAARYGRKDDPKAFLDQAKSRSLSRYTCVNLTNCATVEFRMFRGTLKLNTFLATLQMVSTICDVALSLSDEELKSLTWTEFVTDFCRSPELVQYLKERRLYVSEPVNAEVEI